jgi:hypothetical protein
MLDYIAQEHPLPGGSDHQRERSTITISAADIVARMLAGTNPSTRAVGSLEGGENRRWELVVLALAAGLVSLTAFLLTNARCGAINLAAQTVGRSSYCRMLNSPGLPNHLGSLALTFAIFGLPTVIAAAGAIATLRREHAMTTRLVAICCTLGVLSLLLIAFAHARYAPLD